MGGHAGRDTADLEGGFQRSAKFLAGILQSEARVRGNDEEPGRFVAKRQTRIADGKTVERASAARAILQDLPDCIDDVGIALVAPEAKPERAILRAYARKLHADQREALEIEVTGDDGRRVEIQIRLRRL